MAKQSTIVANERRKEIVARHAARRAGLKDAIRTATDPADVRAARTHRQGRALADQLPQHRPSRGAAGDHQVELVNRSPGQRAQVAQRPNSSIECVTSANRWSSAAFAAQRSTAGPAISIVRPQLRQTRWW